MQWDIQTFDEISREKIIAAMELLRPDVEVSPETEIDGVLAKMENLNPTGAFKVRGGLVYFDWLTSAFPEIKTAVAATRGNHGQSVAYAAGKAGLNSRIVVPYGNSQVKNRAMKELGAEVIEYGDDFADSMAYAEREAVSSNAHFVPSFDWKLVLGVSTYAYELFEGNPDLDAVYVPIGLGSGICGTIAARNALNLNTKIIGVVAENAPAYAESFAAGTVIEGRDIPVTIADGVACRIPNRDSFDVIQRYAEQIVTVPEDDIKNAMDELESKTGFPAEGAGAIAYAAWKRNRVDYKNSAVIFSGGNAD